jgi:hypothetical protein
LPSSSSSSSSFKGAVAGSDYEVLAAANLALRKEVSLAWGEAKWAAKRLDDLMAAAGVADVSQGASVRRWAVAKNARAAQALGASRTAFCIPAAVAETAAAASGGCHLGKGGCTNDEANNEANNEDDEECGLRDEKRARVY